MSQLIYCGGVFELILVMKIFFFFKIMLKINI